MDALKLVRIRELEVAVRIWHPEATKTLVAWHGLARHGGDFADLARELGPNWRILAPDTPGRGLSSWSMFPAHDYLYEHYMQIAVGLLDHFGLPRVIWVGTSMGGLLGMLLAADETHGSRIERLVLNDVGPELNPDGLRALGSRFAFPHRFTSFNELMTDLKQHYQGFGIDSESAWQRLALGSTRRLPDGSWTYHYDPRITEQFVHDTPRDTWEDWARIRCPLMVIRGEHSPLLDAETLPRMRDVQPELECLTIPNCGHAPMLDRPSQVTPLKAFIERPSRTSSAAGSPPLQVARSEGWNMGWRKGWRALQHWWSLLWRRWRGRSR
ncbi:MULTISPECIES: alpha/beta fold hydrolase [Halomonadaceae]|uniref:alpha/beta fold hydrolase n=1 Tax=Halomonadaceae TaxID=28256 RepID=UPI001598C9ED|nr:MULTISPECIES: alpha/beta fold hydrolase [Halomonas]QJQ96090.1 alpha/beta fold hydrolase [Halomonas sp. PA5]